MFVKTLTGKTISIVRCGPDTSVGKFKELIRDEEGTPVDQQRLIYKGKELKDDDATLSHYNVDGGDEPINLASCRGKVFGRESQRHYHGDCTRP